MSGKLIAFWGPCSASGVTTLCARTGAHLAASHPTVTVDLNLFEPSLAIGSDAQVDTCLDAILPLLRGQRLTAEELTWHATAAAGSQACALIPGLLHPLAALDIREADIHCLLDLLLLHYRYVLADVSPTLDSVGTWPVLERADRVVWVVGGQYAARYHSRRYLHIRDQLNLGSDRTLLALNCTEAVAESLVRDELGVDFSVVVPHEPKLSGGFDWGVQKLASLLAPRAASKQAKAGWFSRKRGAGG